MNTFQHHLRRETKDTICRESNQTQEQKKVTQLLVNKLWKKNQHLGEMSILSN